ncbi:hypothetical protein O4J56_17495 [Nocardiopsis sp. RSe5-2]|uniref:Cyclophilin TM1367-like domain-containing protein n=1 Tax=Nocardiopsis endophytica TaxID=3018445 RepID=A0ABT4U672_9ACTN|nr:cyclophilin-like family protein [Nocardiopsis endophytica]MDA2812441.1 hypothetical protein [Nocardiopsis endophytica]
MRIRISWNGGETTAALRPTPTAELLWAALPFEGTAATWGDEVYFPIPVDAGPEPDAAEVVEPGAVCYWLAGSALALPFGPTPISMDDECRLASAANVMGALDGDPRVLETVKAGERVRVESAED